MPRWMLVTIAVLSAQALAAPGALAQGQAEISVGYNGRYYPRTSWPVRVDVHLPEATTARRVLVRFQSPRERCARDRGTSLGRARKISNSGFMARFRTRAHTWRRPGRVRFCAWPGQGRPIVQDVAFFGTLFGAAMSPDRFLTGFRNTVASSVPFRDVAERASSDAACRSAPETFTFAPPEYRPPLFTADGANNFVGCRDAKDMRTYTLLADPSGRAVADPQGSMAYTLTDAHHHVIRHMGACVFEPELDNRKIADAIAYVRAVGCKPGRQIAIPRAPIAFGYPAPGAVYAYAVNGGRAVLVPRGTTVDLIVNREPSPTA